jgi:hypothetical protein
MYQPSNTNGLGYDRLDEFMELRNLTSDPVALGASTSTPYAWQIQGGIEYSFPSNIVLAADGYLLVVSFDPERDPAALAAFCLKYQVPSNARVLGPYAGRLDNDGERLELYRPVVVSSRAPGVWANMLADAVSYANRLPWPAEASGGGASLQRIKAADYGNDAVNWTAASPTAGWVNFREDYPVRLGGMTRDSAGKVGLRLTGLTGQSYLLEWSTNLQNWTVLKTVETIDGQIDYSDPDTGGFARRFYRARQAP